MSIGVMTRVWRHSSQKGGALLVLLAIADYADDHGRAYPSVETLSAKSRLSERAVQAALGRLTSAGELAVDPQAGPHRCNLYTVLVHPDGADSAPRKRSTPQKRVLESEGAENAAEGAETDAQRVQFATQRVQPAAPKPSLRTVNKNRQLTVRDSRTRAREEIQTMDDLTMKSPPDAVICLGCGEFIDSTNFRTAHVDCCQYERHTPGQLAVRQAAGPVERRMELVANG